MRFFNEKKSSSPTSSLDNGTQNYPGQQGYGYDEAKFGGPQSYNDDLHVQCPPHTTERKLVTKIDFHVVPFLCILYLLAFLDR